MFVWLRFSRPAAVSRSALNRRETRKLTAIVFSAAIKSALRVAKKMAYGGTLYIGPVEGQGRKLPAATSGLPEARRRSAARRNSRYPRVVRGVSEADRRALARNHRPSGASSRLRERRRQRDVPGGKLGG